MQVPPSASHYPIQNTVTSRKDTDGVCVPRAPEALAQKPAQPAPSEKSIRNTLTGFVRQGLKVLHPKPVSSRDLFEQGAALLDKSDYEGAEKMFSKALEVQDKESAKPLTLKSLTQIFEKQDTGEKTTVSSKQPEDSDWWDDLE